METQETTKQYFMKFAPAMAIYGLGTLSISWAENSLGLSIILLYAFSSIPILALLSAMWVHWHYVKELDEFLFMIQIKGMLFGLALILVGTSVWGILETLADAPRIKLLWVPTIFAISYGLATIFFTYREPDARS